MKIFTLKYEQYISRPRNEIFTFFSRPENLAHITPTALGFIILTPSPIEMRPGVLISYMIRIFGIRVRWISIITSYDPPMRFVDEQLRGPYSFWHHTHTFKEHQGGTLITDEVKYAVPFGILGRVVRRIIIRRQLDKIFSYRAEVIREIFSDNK
ncbi:MAG: SRPBCC family protein [Ignavibacteriales bacterium]|nr:SRPBCC family protein [Ignavibacteriales bacterium]